MNKSVAPKHPSEDIYGTSPTMAKPFDNMPIIECMLMGTAGSLTRLLWTNDIHCGYARIDSWPRALWRTIGPLLKTPKAKSQVVE